MKKAVIYCRVSTKEQVDEGNSLATQERLCRDYALKNGFDIVQVFIEQGESAKTAQRTELQNLLAYCAVRKNQVQAVMTYKLDRLSRNTDDYSQIRLLLKRYGIEIKSITEFFENTPAGRFMENIIANVAQFDNDVRTERCTSGMREAVREGRYVWKAPFGYENIRIAGKATIRHSSKAPLIREAFQRIAGCVSPIDEVRRQMALKGMVDRKGQPLAKGYFHRLIRNELYAGWIIKFGNRRRGTFEPIVSEELFEQVQLVVRHKGHRTLQYKTDNPDFPLRRFVRNPIGKNLTGSWCKGRRNKYPYYWFAVSGTLIRKEEMESLFAGFFDTFQIDDEQSKKIQSFFQQQLVKKQSDKAKRGEQIKKVIGELKEKQALLIDKNLAGILSDALLQNQLEIIEQELIKQYASLQQHPVTGINIKRSLKLVDRFLRHPGQTWHQAPFEQKLALQWFNFPQGVIYDGTKFRTAEISRILNLKEQFVEPKFSTVDSGFKRLNNLELTSEISLEEFTLELQRFTDSMNGKKEQSLIDDLHNEQISHPAS